MIQITFYTRKSEENSWGGEEYVFQARARTVLSWHDYSLSCPRLLLGVRRTIYGPNVHPSVAYPCPPPPFPWTPLTLKHCVGLFWVNPPILNLHIQNRLLSSGPPVSLRTCSALFDKVTPPYYFPHDVSLHWLWSQIWSLNYDSANQLMQNAYRYLILDASSLSVLKFPGGGGDMIGSVPLQCYRCFFFYYLPQEHLLSSFK